MQQLEITTSDDQRQERLQELKSVIARGRDVFIEVGQALDGWKKPIQLGGGFGLKLSYSA